MSDEYKKFINHPNGIELLERCTIDDFGVWEITTENPNSDLYGGSPIHLATIQNTLKKVIEWATSQPNFWLFKNCPGHIHKIVLTEI